MGTAVFDETTLRLVEWVESGPAPPARPNLVNVTLARPPDAITERYDGAGGARAATQAELDADVQTARDAEKDRYDMPEAGVMFRALVEVLLSEINTLRSSLALSPRTRAQARTALRNALDDLTL